MTPPARSLAYLRLQGHTVQVVERFILGVKIQRDLFGCIDIFAIRGDRSGVLGVQATTSSHVVSRKEKAEARPELQTWLRVGKLL